MKAKMIIELNSITFHDPIDRRGDFEVVETEELTRLFILLKTLRTHVEGTILVAIEPFKV